MSAPLAQGSPSPLASSLWQKRISLVLYLPPFAPLPAFYSSLLNSSAVEAAGTFIWDVNETFSLKEAGEFRARRQGQSPNQDNDDSRRLFLSRSLPSLVLLNFACCHSVCRVEGWLKSALCHGRHISHRHKTCRTINKQQATVRSSNPGCLSSGGRGERDTGRLGLWGVCRNA